MDVDELHLIIQNDYIHHYEETGEPRHDHDFEIQLVIIRGN